MATFTLLDSSNAESRARLGQLQIEGRKKILTPHYVAIASRGTVPHLTQDTMRDETSISGLYVALEDFVERPPPQVCSLPCLEEESPLRKFLSLQKEVFLVLGPRRTPTVPSPVPNTFTSLAINTAYGYRQMEISDYLSFSKKFRPDVIVAPVDHFVGDRNRKSAKRKERMDERSVAWMKAAQRTGHNTGSTSYRNLWAPILALPQADQRSYLEHLEESGPETFGGVVVYDDKSILDAPETFVKLPCLSLSEPKTPQVLLQAINLGIDIFTAPFVSAATDAGVALTFTFPVSSMVLQSTATGARLPLGFSLWNTAYDTDLSALIADCTCYACKFHHRAYIRHLLNTKEMLAWVLLQIHNHHQLDIFFVGIRQSIAQATFVDDAAAFARIYVDDLPADGGEGPRVRGYQVRKADAQPLKANRSAYKKLSEADLEAIEAAKALKKSKTLDNEAQKLAEAVEEDIILPSFMNE